MDFLKNQLIENVTITGYNSDGQGVARVNDRVIFVDGAARGDVATLRILKTTTRIAYAKIEQLTTPSPYRIEPACPVYRQCGGCVYAHIDYQEEFYAKKQHVVDTLQRLGHCQTLPTPIEVPAPDVCHYRNKALYPLADGPVFGFYRQRSHEVVAVSRCAIQDPRADAAAQAVTQWMREYGIRPYNQLQHNGLIRHVFARTGSRGCLLAVVANGPPSRTRTLVEALRAACPDVVGVVWVENEKRDNVVLQGKTKVLWGQGWLDEQLCGLDFRVSVFSFFQVNRTQAEALYALAVDFAQCGDNATVVDLFCGTGTLALCMAQGGAQAWGIDCVPEAIDDARANAERNGLPTQFLCADAADGLAQLTKQGIKPDVLVVDPPRKGLSEALIALLAHQRADRIVYVSCNPATLARDLAQLREHGYDLTKLAIVDLFPRTKHVETVVLMSKKSK